MAEADRTPDELADDLVTARDEFLAAMTRLDVRRLNSPSLLGTWGIREVIAHLGYWAGHAADAIHHAEQGRADEFGERDLDVEERNELVARIAREADLATASAREEGAYQALVDRIRRLDPAWLDERVAYGDTIGQVIVDDGADHYRGHAAELLEIARQPS